MKETILNALDEIRPYLRTDGGDIELVDFDEENMVVSVRLLGNCASCPMNGSTMKLGVENTIKSHIPEIKQVIKVS